MARTSFEPLAPIKLRKPNGRVLPFGYGKNTDALRGVALQQAVTKAEVGDVIDVGFPCELDGGWTKPGVRLRFASNARLRDTSLLPDVVPTDLTGNKVMNRSREAFLYEKDERFCYFKWNGHSANSYSDLIVAKSASQTWTPGLNMGRYVSSEVSANSAYMMSSARVRTSAQHVSSIKMLQHEPKGTSYCDLGVGFGITTNANSDTCDYYVLAMLRRTPSNPVGTILLFHTWSAGGGGNDFVSANLTDPIPMGSRLCCIQNHNDIALAVVYPDGREVILLNDSIETARWNFEEVAVLDRMRYVVFMQSDGDQEVEFTDFQANNLGMLGEREHVLATYENGEPIVSQEGYVYCSMDMSHISSGVVANPIANSPYMRNQNGMRLLDPVSCRWVRTTARYIFEKNGRRYGCQEVKVVYDRDEGCYYVTHSEWNDDSDEIFVYIWKTYEDALHGTHVMREEDSTAFSFDISVDPPDFVTNGNGIYGLDWFKTSDGTWYVTGTVRDVPITGVGNSRTIWMAHGDTFETATELDWVQDEVTEGSYFWSIGGDMLVFAGVGGVGGRLYNMDGTLNRSFTTLPGIGRYPLFGAMLPSTYCGKTCYLLIGFSDVQDPANAPLSGEDYIADFNDTIFPLAFGTLIVIKIGEAEGQEFTKIPRNNWL